MTNLEWLKTLSAEELADWFYDEWLHHLQYRWSSSRGGLIIWLKDRKTENCSEKPNNCTNCECTDDCTECREAEHGCKDEPQTDCGDFADRLAYERGVKHAWEVAQKVFDSTVTFYEAEDVAKQIDKDINVRSKTEPQIDEEYINNLPWTEVGNGEQTERSE